MVDSSTVGTIRVTIRDVCWFVTVGQDYGTCTMAVLIRASSVEALTVGET